MVTLWEGSPEGVIEGQTVHRTGHILLLHHSEGERMRYVADWFTAGLLTDDMLLYVDVAGWGAGRGDLRLDRRRVPVRAKGAAGWGASIRPASPARNPLQHPEVESLGSPS